MSCGYLQPASRCLLVASLSLASYLVKSQIICSPSHILSAYRSHRCSHVGPGGRPAPPFSIELFLCPAHATPLALVESAAGHCVSREHHGGRLIIYNTTSPDVKRDVPCRLVRVWSRAVGRIFHERLIASEAKQSQGVAASEPGIAFPRAAKLQSARPQRFAHRPIPHSQRYVRYRTRTPRK